MGKVRYWEAKERGKRITRLLARDGNLCYLCGQVLDRKIDDVDSPWYITFDHVIRRADGGPDHTSNIRLAHKKCNQERQDTHLPAKTFDKLVTIEVG